MKSWASALGQRFGDILQIAMDISFEEFADGLQDKGLKSIGGGKEKVLSGDTQQIDGRLVNSKEELIIIGESKWLKDQRHQNDKGAWIILLGDMCRANPTIKGVIALLAGPWTGTRHHKQMIKQGIKTIVITLDDFKKFLHEIGLTTYEITSPQDGNTVVDPERVSLQLCDLEEKLLDKGLNPYEVWAKKVLDELKPEGKTVTVREAIAKYLSEINSRVSPSEQFTVAGFTLQLETNMGPFKIAGIDIDETASEIVKAIRNWKEDPTGMLDKLFSKEE